jgi:hypothetical protein
MFHHRTSFILPALALLLAACGGQAATPTHAPIQEADASQFKQLAATQSSGRVVAISGDARGATVNVNDIQQGCSVQDCIPALDHPIFEAVPAAKAWLRDGDIVFGISYKGIHRAYPQRIMNWHEIVNDTIKGDPILITFCPLCGSALAFRREVEGGPVTFGVSGLLYNSDLIMYDRREGSLWQQFSGRAIAGPAAQRNERLQVLEIGTTTWGQWRRDYPHAQVLSRDTGYARDYNVYPYGTYERDNELYFGVQHTDKRLQIKTVVYGVRVGGRAKAYPLDTVRKAGEIVDRLGPDTIVIRQDTAGVVHALDRTTGRAITPLRTFWFAWAAFHPGTALYRPT